MLSVVRRQKQRQYPPLVGSPLDLSPRNGLHPAGRMVVLAVLRRLYALWHLVLLRKNMCGVGKDNLVSETLYCSVKLGSKW